MRVLLVEDDESVQAVLCRLLPRRIPGTFVTVCAEYDMAVAALRSGDFDLVVSDGTIIGGHGTQLFAEHADTAGIPWIFLSAEADEKIFHGVRAAPLCRGVFCKPLRSIDDLADAIRRALESPSGV